MNFQKIPSPLTGKEMLDMAFKKARQRGQSKKLIGNWLETIRKKEALKLDIIKDSLITRLQKILDSYPGLKDLPPFYVRLLKLTIDYPHFKKSLGSIDWAIKRVNFFHRASISKIFKTKKKGPINDISKQFYGRVSSVLKQIEKYIQFLDKSRSIMKTYPDVKDLFTVCIYGFPNVGKTTLLNQLAGTKAKTAAYAFTTKTINAGYTEINGKKVQFLDVPGTLARGEKRNNIEKQAELVVEDVADIIIYVFDISEQCGFSLRKQEQLFDTMNSSRKIIVYLSKKDLLEKEKITQFDKVHYDLAGLKQKIKNSMKSSHISKKE